MQARIRPEISQIVTTAANAIKPPELVWNTFSNVALIPANTSCRTFGRRCGPI